MANRPSLKVTITSTFTIPAPTNDELIKLAEDAGMEGDEPSEQELDEAYENWKNTVESDFEDGKDPPDDATSIVEFDEVP